METHRPARTASDSNGYISDQDFNEGTGGGEGGASGSDWREGETEGESTMPLFRLKLGVAPSSDGIACARTAGEIR